MSSGIVYSTRPEVNIPLISISKLLISRMKYFGNKKYLTEYNSQRVFSFSQINEDCLRMSNIWLSLGLKPGNRFGICGYNSYEYMVCLLSGIFVGGTAVPMRGIDTIDEIKRSITERNVQLMAFSAETLIRIKESEAQYYENLKGVVFGRKNESQFETHFLIYENLIETTQPLNEQHIYEPNDVKEYICLLLESSGTTGLPKGCLFSHYNLVALVTIGSIEQMYNRTDEDIVSGHGYAAHISGISQLIMSITNGSQLILHPKFEFNTFCAAIERHRITTLSGPTSIFMTLLMNGSNYDISSLKKVICGGAPLPKGCAEQIVAKYPHLEDFRQGYGMTEMTILIAFGDYGTKHYESVGPPTPGNSIKIIDCNTGQILSNNQTGEICVTGPTLFKGYDNNIEATNNTIDCDNYLHTGDLGYYDTDSNLYILDRIKLLLKTDGMQVSPTELESVFLKHSSVKEVTVIGKPDKISGQLATAFVVIKDEFKDTIDSNQLLQFVNNQITPLKRIRGGIYIVDNIPKNKNGKADRNQLAQLF